MYVFGRSAVGRQDFDVFFFKPIFGDFRENIHFTHCKMYVFAFSNVCQKKYVVLEVFLGAAKKVCDPACGLLGGPGRVGLGSGRSW